MTFSGFSMVFRINLVECLTHYQAMALTLNKSSMQGDKTSHHVPASRMERQQGIARHCREEEM